MPSAEAYLKRLADDFEFFLKELWRETGLDKKAPIEEADLVLARWMDHGTRTRGAKAPRGIGKSTIGTSGYAAYRLNRACMYAIYQWTGHETIGDPNFRIKVVSKSHRHATDMISTLRGWVDDVWFLNYLKPDDSDKRYRDNKESFDVGPSTPDKNPSVSAAGIEGQITGTRAHLLIADDIETPSNTKTVRAREELDNQVREFRSIASFGEREILILGTPHTRETLYNKMPARGYEFRTIPLILPKPGWQDKYLDPWVLDKLAELGRDVKDGEIIPLWGRMGRDLVLERMAEGPIEFCRQQMLVADAEDLEYPLRLSDLIVPDFKIDRDSAPIWVKWGRTTGNGMSTMWDLDVAGMSGDMLYRQIAYSDQTAPYQKTVMRVDPSGRGKDQTAWAAVSYLGGYLWVKGVKGDGHQDDRAGDSPEIMRQIATDARAWGVNDIVVEQQFGGDSFAQLLEIEVNKLKLEPGESAEYPQGWRASVFVKPARGQKERRVIAALSRAMSAHRLIIAPEHISLTPGLDIGYELQYQCTSITEQPDCLVHDDKIEALAGCVEEFVEDLRMSPEVMEQKLADEELDRQLAEIYGSQALGSGRWSTEW